MNEHDLERRLRNRLGEVDDMPVHRPDLSDLHARAEAGDGTLTAGAPWWRSPPTLILGAAAAALVLVMAVVVFDGGDDTSSIGTVDQSSTSTSEPEPEPDSSSSTTPDDDGDPGDVDPDDPEENGPNQTDPDQTDPPALPAGVQPVIVADGYPLGWWNGDGWEAAPSFEPAVDPADDALPFADQLDFVALDGSVITTEPGALTEGCFNDTQPPLLNNIDARDRVGVPAGWNARPREVTEISAAPEHTASVREWLAAQGYGDEAVDIDQVLRFDLDGDGDLEVLIHAQQIRSQTSFGHPEGDYDVLLLRRVDDDDAVETLEVAGDIVTADEVSDEETTLDGLLARHSVLGVLDASGDGEYEVIVTISIYESWLLDLVDFDADERPTVALDWGCGA